MADNLYLPDNSADHLVEDDDWVPMVATLNRPQKDNYLYMYYQNVRGLRTKTSKLFLSIESCDFDIIALSETWLNSSIYDSEMFTSDFTVYRCDRSATKSGLEMGCGVLLAVRSSELYSSDQIYFPVDSVIDIDIVFVKLKFRTGKNVFLCCLYVRSNSNDDVYEAYIDVLECFFGSTNLSCDDTVFIMGDFNMPHVCWSIDHENNNILLPHGTITSIQENMFDTLLGRGLSQLNGVKNCRGRLLDLVFADNADDVRLYECSHPMINIDAYHPAFEIIFDHGEVGVNAPPPLDDLTFNFKKTNFIRLNEYLNLIDWDTKFNGCRDCNDTVDILYDVLNDGFEQFVPKINSKKSTHPIWYNKHLLHLKNLKKKAHLRYKCSFRQDDYTAYSLLRKKYSLYQKVCYKKYLRKTQSNLTRNPSQFWSYVQSKKKISGFPKTMSHNTISSSTVEGICDLFALFFKRVYVEENVGDVPDSFGLSEDVCLGSIVLSRADVLKSLLNISVDKGSGPDNISPLILRNCAYALLTPLYHIFSQSLSSGHFPKRWKISYITPIFKTGSRKNVENYRGIAILPTIGKLFESIICDVLAVHIKHSISVNQHGFIKARSTTTNLVEFTNHAVNVVESGMQLDVVYTDFSKAFDTVCHRILLKKLSEMGLHSSILRWIGSYLGDREQYVKIGSCRSCLFPVKSGVPQGSHLGPLLFNLFINDIANIFRYSRCLLYADDLKIFCRVNSLSDAANVQTDLDALSSWCEKNRLSLNVDKCRSMTYHRKTGPIYFDYVINNTRLLRVNEIRDLGLLFDEKITFVKHVDILCAKACSLLGFLMRVCRDFDDPLALKVLYYAHIRSILEFASVVWYPNYDVHVKRIESVQKKFLKFVFCRFGFYRYVQYAPYTFKCALLNIESLATRRRNACIYFIYDLLMCRIDASFLLSLIDFNVPSRSLRNHNLLRLRKHRTNYGSHEPINNMSCIVNSVHSILDFNLSRSIFRQRVISFNSATIDSGASIGYLGGIRT